MKDTKALDKKLVRQDNALTNAHYRMTVLEKNIFLAVMGELSEKDPQKTQYKIHAKRLEQFTGSQTGLKQYKEATKKMIQRVIEIERYKEYEGQLRKTTLQVPLVASAEYIHGTGIIEIEISEKLRPLLFDLKRNFTQYSLSNALKLKSTYAKRIYEILNQWKDKKEKEYAIPDLKYILGLIPSVGEKSKDKEQREKFKQHGEFDRYVIKQAQKEINQFTDINFKYEYRKTGRQFSHIKFLIEYRPENAQVELKPDERDLSNRLRAEFKLSAAMTKKIIENIPEQPIRETLYEIQISKMNNKIQTNIGAYTAGVFRKKFDLI